MVKAEFAIKTKIPYLLICIDQGCDFRFFSFFYFFHFIYISQFAEELFSRILFIRPLPLSLPLYYVERGTGVR